MLYVDPLLPYSSKARFAGYRASGREAFLNYFLLALFESPLDAIFCDYVLERLSD